MKKVIVVSGGTSGIGKATVQLLAQNPNNLVYSLARHPVSCDLSNVQELKCDVADDKSVEQAVYQITKKHNRIDVLINDAGTNVDNYFVMMSRQAWDHVINTNLGGCFNLTKSVLPYMISNHYGKICNVSSVSGIEGKIGQANYSASKAGIIGFTKTLSKEYAKYHINVNSVAPGFIDTSMTRDVPHKQKYIKRIPLARFGTPKEVANVIQFLVSDKSSYVTGENIVIDGGLKND